MTSALLIMLLCSPLGMVFSFSPPLGLHKAFSPPIMRRAAIVRAPVSMMSASRGDMTREFVQKHSLDETAEQDLNNLIDACGSPSFDLGSVGDRLGALGNVGKGAVMAGVKNREDFLKSVTDNAANLKSTVTDNAANLKSTVTENADFLKSMSSSINSTEIFKSLSGGNPAVQAAISSVYNSALNVVRKRFGNISGMSWALLLSYVIVQSAFMAVAFPLAWFGLDLVGTEGARWTIGTKGIAISLAHMKHTLSLVWTGVAWTKPLRLVGVVFYAGKAHRVLMAARQKFRMRSNKATFGLVLSAITAAMTLLFGLVAFYDDWGEISEFVGGLDVLGRVKQFVISVAQWTRFMVAI